MGFGVPINYWLRGELKDYLRENLLSEKFAKRGIVKLDLVRHLVEEHINGKQDFTPQLWTLLMLELWFQRFIDN